MRAMERWVCVPALVLFVALALPHPASGQAAQAETQVVEGLTMDAALKAVDLDRNIFLVMGEEGNEMLFHFNAQTEVIDRSDGVQGLTGESGTWLRIAYRAEGTDAVAERIEAIERPDPNREEPNERQQPAGAGGAEPPLER